MIEEMDCFVEIEVEVEPLTFGACTGSSGGGKGAMGGGGMVFSAVSSFTRLIRPSSSSDADEYSISWE